jgi:hypothetical protein
MMAALVLSGYFAGFTIGAPFCIRIVERFGHIRAYILTPQAAILTPDPLIRASSRLRNLLTRKAN